jgi:hypothetical protein
VSAGSWSRVVGMFAATLVPALAGGADWSAQSAAHLSAVTESNPQLLVDEKHAAQAAVADASLDLLRRTELLDLNLKARGSVRRYSEDSSLDRDDQQVALSLLLRGERHVVKGSASITRDTTLTSELGTTGITDYNQRHRARSLSLAPQWQLTERLTTSVSLGWQDSTYARGQEHGLSDYHYTSAGLSSAFDLSTTDSASLSMSASRLDSSLYAFNTDTVDVRLQLQRTWSPRWTTSISGGTSRIKTGDRESRGSLFGASLLHQAERLTLDVSLSRSNAPTGSGLQSRRDEAGVHASLALTEHVNASINASVIRSRELAPQFNFTISDVRYTRAEASLSWRMARDWNLLLGAGNSMQKRLAGSGNANSLDARLQLSWQHYNPVG